MYLLDAENRRLSNLFLPKKLDRYLSKWVGKGIYNAVFDNVEDSLSLSRLQCFDFQGVNNEQYADLIEPLMVWLLRRINDVLYNPANLGVPKHILIEEIFSSMKNKQLLDGALASIKTVRKNLGGVTMIGQSADDLWGFPVATLPRPLTFGRGKLSSIWVQAGDWTYFWRRRWLVLRVVPLVST
jgi:type IV secretion system protein VirB4